MRQRPPDLEEDEEVEPGFGFGFGLGSGFGFGFGFGLDLVRRAVDIGEAAAGRGEEEVLDALVVGGEDADRGGEGDGVEELHLVGEGVE